MKVTKFYCDICGVESKQSDLKPIGIHKPDKEACPACREALIHVYDTKRTELMLNNENII